MSAKKTARPLLLVVLCACLAGALQTVRKVFNPPSSHSAAVSEPVQRPPKSGAVHMASHVDDRSARPARPLPARMQVYSHPDEAPEWTVTYGQEFWRQPVDITGQSAPKDPLDPVSPGQPRAIPHSIVPPVGALSTLPPPIQLPDVIERVSHALHQDAASGLPQVKARTYTARFDGRGLGFSPHRPQSRTGVPPVPREDTSSHSAEEDGRDARPTLPLPDPGTEAFLHTVSVTRQSHVLYAADVSEPAWCIVGNTAQALLDAHSGLVEHYEATREGVSITWAMPEPLPGAGPLLITAQLDGLAYAGSSKLGQHFADAGGTARVCVGPVQAVDAAGTSWDLPLEMAGSQLRVQVPEEILGEATYPLAIDPLIGPEFGMDNLLKGPAYSTQYEPAVASNGTNYLVVWHEDSGSGADYNILASRVTAAGGIADPKGIVVSTAQQNQSAAVVASSGGDYLVVWEDQRAFYATGYDIYGARVRASGAVADPGGIAICAAADSQTEPAVAATAAGYLVVWRDDRNATTNGYDIYGARVNRSGAVLDLNGTAISTAPNQQESPALSGAGNGYLVVWRDRRNFSTNDFDIFGARVTGGGFVSDPDGIAICTEPSSQQSPAVAGRGNGFLVVWEDNRGASTNGLDIYGARVTSAGLVSDTNGFPVCAVPGDQRGPEAAASAAGYFVVWQDPRNSAITDSDIYGARVSSAGAVAEPDGIAVCTAPGTQSLPTLAAGPGGYLVGWQDDRSAQSGSDIFGARVTATGTVRDTAGLPISLGPSGQFHPAVAANGTNFLVVWEDDRDYLDRGLDIYGTRVTSAGRVADPSGLAICTLTNDQSAPAVAANGTSFLVVWQDGRNDATSLVDIYGSRVSARGAVLDPNGIAISTANNFQLTPGVAATAGDYLVVWTDQRSQPDGDIYGARVGSAGAVADPDGIPICTATAAQSSAVAAGLAGHFLVVWEETRNGPQIYGSLVSSDGTVTPPDGAPITPGATNAQTAPAVAAGASDFLVAWQDYLTAEATAADIYAARVDPRGATLDVTGFPVSVQLGDQWSPAVAAFDGDWLVAWADIRFDAALYAARVTSEAAVLDGSGWAIFGSSQRFAPALTSAADGRFLLVSEGNRSRAFRTAANLLTADPPALVPIVQFKSANFSVRESARAATITVSLSGPNPGLITAAYKACAGTASEQVDFGFTAGTLVFERGRTNATFTVPIIDDTLDETNETVNLRLESLSGGAVFGARQRAWLTILDDDSGGVVQFGTARLAVNEVSTNVVLNVNRARGAASGVTVDYALAGTAVAGLDYVGMDGTLTFGAGVTRQSITLGILQDMTAETNETIVVTLSNPTGGATLGPTNRVTLTIRANNR
jgi:hypothetical protein